MALGAELKDFVSAFQTGWRLTSDSMDREYQKERDKIGDKYKDKEFDYRANRDAVDDQYRSTELGMRREALDISRAEAEDRRLGRGYYDRSKRGDSVDDEYRSRRDEALSGDPVDIVARTLIGEAAGEGDEGMTAVAWSMKNRSDKWGMPIEKVALQPKQYSTWNKGEGGNDLPYKYNPGDEVYDRARAIAERVLAGELDDPTGGATHYYAPNGMPGGKKPYWWDDELRKAGGDERRIGNHRFAGGRVGDTVAALPIDEESV